MNFIVTLEAVAPVSRAGLSLSDILRSLPTDPASIVALILGVGFLALIFYYGTRSGPPPETSDPRPGDPSTEDTEDKEVSIP
jgi:hypothetical protein